MFLLACLNVWKDLYRLYFNLCAFCEWFVLKFPLLELALSEIEAPELTVSVVEAKLILVDGFNCWLLFFLYLVVSISIDLVCST